MKKLALATVCAMAVSGAAFAQGLINWATPSSSITVQTNSGQFSPLFGGGVNASGGVANMPGSAAGSFGFALLYQTFPGLGAGGLATDTNVWDGTWQATGLIGTNSTFAHNVAPINTGTVTVNSLINTNSIVLVGWSANLGSDWATVSNILRNWSTDRGTIVGQAFFGETSFGYLTGNAAPAPGASVFGNGTASANGLPIFSLNTQLYLLPTGTVVPEPATMALAGLGGLSLLLFRRQRK